MKSKLLTRTVGILSTAILAATQLRPGTKAR